MGRKNGQPTALLRMFTICGCHRTSREFALRSTKSRPTSTLLWIRCLRPAYPKAWEACPQQHPARARRPQRRPILPPRRARCKKGPRQKDQGRKRRFAHPSAVERSVTLKQRVRRPVMMDSVTGMAIQNALIRSQRNNDSGLH